MDCLQRLEPSVSGGDDFVGISAPDEWLCLGFVVFGDEAVDGGLKINERMEHAVFQSAARELGEKAFYRVQPEA